MRKLRFFVIFLFLDLNTTSSVLLVFKDSLLVLIHSTTSFRSLFIWLFNIFSDFSARSISVFCKVMHCAEFNIHDSQYQVPFVNQGIPRKHISQNHNLLPHSDLLMLVYCILSLKNEQNQLFAIPLIP